MKKTTLLRILSLLLLLPLLFSLGSCGALFDDILTDPFGDPFATSAPDTETAPPPSDGSSFAVHFIDVGQADAALVLCDGKAMLIDGGNRADSDLIYAYLKKLDLTYLDYVVCTHADEDHVGGLAGALSFATAGEVWCPVKTYTSKAFQNFADKVAAQGKELIMPPLDSTVMLGSASVTVLGPRATYSDNNNTSIVLRIVYGETSFLFTGDAARESEEDLLAAGVNLSATVLKVGHHGSESSTTYPFLREIMPQYAVISVGADNSYGHPTQDALSRLRNAGATILRTDQDGDIIFTSDGYTVKLVG